MNEITRIALGCVLALAITVVGARLLQPGIPPSELALAGTLAVVIAALYGITRARQG